MGRSAPPRSSEAARAAAIKGRMGAGAVISNAGRARDRTSPIVSAIVGSEISRSTSPAKLTEPTYPVPPQLVVGVRIGNRRFRNGNLRTGNLRPRNPYLADFGPRASTLSRRSEARRVRTRLKVDKERVASQRARDGRSQELKAFWVRSRPTESRDSTASAA